jgi:hypothetical protein
MLQAKKTIIYIVLGIIISNMPFVSEVLSITFYDTVGIPFHFITKDAHFYSTGDINKILASDGYQKYKSSFPQADTTLYRCFRKKDWKYFFLWRHYMTDANWRAPYISDPSFMSHYRGDYQLGFNETRRPYKWDDNTGHWIKLVR